MLLLGINVNRINNINKFKNIENIENDQTPNIYYSGSWLKILNCLYDLTVGYVDY